MIDDCEIHEINGVIAGVVGKAFIYFVYTLGSCPNHTYKLWYQGMLSVITSSCPRFRERWLFVTLDLTGDWILTSMTLY